MRLIRDYKDVSGRPVRGRVVDQEYFAKLEQVADAASALVNQGLDTGRVRSLETTLRELEALQPRQNRWRTDAEVAERLPDTIT